MLVIKTNTNKSLNALVINEKYETGVYTLSITFSGEIYDLEEVVEVLEEGKHELNIYHQDKLLNTIVGYNTISYINKKFIENVDGLNEQVIITVNLTK